MRPAVLLDPQAGPQRRGDRWPALNHVEIADPYDLEVAGLDGVGVLLIAGMVDQEHLWRRREVVAGFLERGGVVVFCGQLFRRWLPGCEPFVPAAITGFGDYAVDLTPGEDGEPHPVFAGVDPVDLTFRRGVAGFFARGHHPPPPGARILATLAGGQPITWVDRATSAGTVFVHAGADLLGYGGDGSSASRLVPQLLAWADAQASRP
ncbi:MAG: phosphate starvation-inducible protein PhoH [Acidimicrobiales bacterium]